MITNETIQSVEEIILEQVKVAALNAFNEHIKWFCDQKEYDFRIIDDNFNFIDRKTGNQFIAIDFALPYPEVVGVLDTEIAINGIGYTLAQLMPNYVNGEIISND